MATQAEANAFVNDPVTFMKHNIVRWEGGAPANQQVVTVAMIDEAGAGRRRSGLRKIDIPRYKLRLSIVGDLAIPPGSPTFQAVWSGYKGGEEKTASLAAAGGPGLMLTAQLTGCTVVCRPNGDGSAHFSHYNLTQGNQVLDRPTMQAIAEAQYGGGQTTLTKEDYRAVGKHSPAVRVNVIGVRRNGRWEFWAQICEDKASGQQLREMRKLA